MIEIDELAGPDSTEGHRLAKYWRELLDQTSDDREHKRWIKRGESIEKRYRDERNRIDEEGQRRYNSLWSNVEILYPALYGKCPLPVAERRFRDKDPVGRGAAQMLERALRNEIEINGYDDSLRYAVRDYLLSGRGTVWVRYLPEIEEGISLPVENKVDIKDSSGWIKKPQSDDDPEQTHLRDSGDRVLRESISIDYIHWQDFRTLPVRARTWAEIIAVAKKVYMTRSQMCKRFGKEIGGAVPLERDDRGTRPLANQPGGQSSHEGTDTDKGIVWEIWSRDDKQVYWVAENYEFLLDRKDDPLQLEYFYPCPRPLYANLTGSTLTPVPDYLQYQDQAIQIDELTQRIAMLTKACKIAGVYNSAAKSIQRLFNESVENELIPVDDWGMFAEAGGVEGNISFVPIKDIFMVLQELIQCKKLQIDEMDRITGISDILRGTTDARETLGAQRLKVNGAGTRLTHRQNEVARFARDTVRLMADVMANHFSPQSLIETSGAMYEEGLGPEQIPDLSTLNQMAPGANAAPPIAPGMPGAAPPRLPSPASGAAPPPMGGAPPGPMPPMGGPPPPMGGPPGMQGAPPAPMGQNVVPFPSPQGGPPGQSPPQQPLQGQILPPVPPLPPQLLEHFKAIQRIMAAIQLIRDEKQRGFRVDIEVDSTIFGDQAQEKGDRTEFIMAVTKYLSESMMMGMQMPEVIPLLGKILQFGVRGFRVGRDLEAAIEDFCDQAPKVAQQKAAAMAQMPNPETYKVMAEQIKAQSAQQLAQMNLAREQAKTQADMQATQLDAAKTQAESQAEIQRQHLENQGEMYNSMQDTEQKQIDHEMRMIELQIRREELRGEMIKAQAAREQAEFDVQAARLQAQADAEQAEAKIKVTKMQARADADQAKADITLAKHKITEARARPKPSKAKK
jgi:hypothetical protein